METTTDTRTVEVEIWPGKPENITKAQFIQRWMDHVHEFNKLVENSSDIRELTSFKNWVRDKAGQAFEETYDKQTAQRN